MAINSQKFLPPSKISSSSSMIKVGKVVPSLYKKTSALKSKSSDVDGELLVIKTKVVDISNLVSSTTLLKKKTEKENRKEKEEKKREEKENKLEKKDNKLISKLPSFNLPKLGFLDAINRFITFTLLGWVFKRIYPYIPQILGFIKKIDPVIKFVEVLAGNFFKGVVDFIDFGYKAHDTVRDFTKKIGGENLQKTFDDFTKNLNTFVELALIAGMLSTGGPNLGSPKGGPRGGKPGKGGDWRTEGNVIKGKGGFKQAYDNMLKKGNLTKGEQRVVRDYKRLVKAGYHPDSAANQAFFRNRPEWLSGRNVRGGGFSVETAKDYRTAAKGNVVKPKLRLSFGKGIFGRVPIIGGLLDFAFSLAMGEPVGRAAAKAVGSTLGSALGTLIPIPFAGTILGGILGDIVGGALYDTLTANKPKKMAGGGKVTTRKGKVVGGKIKRTVRRVTSPSKAKQVKPGTSVGGEKKVKQIYPEPPKQQVGKMMNPYGFLTKTTKDMGSIPFLGPIFNIFGKTLLGDSPSKDDYKIIGSSINAWINNAISKGILQGNLMSAFADGGVVDIENEMKRNISGWVEKSVEELVRNKVTAAINELRRNLGLKPLGITGAEVPQGLGDGLGLYVSSDSPDFWLLATAALFENSDPQGAADVAQAIYNRVAMPGDPWHVDNSIRKAILDPNQFQPVRQYGGTSAWSAIKTKEDAIRFVKTYGKSQSQLETVAAAILDKNKQASARQFVGPRDSFRATSYEAANNHLADETEVRRLGHAFGFEPRGATIGMFKQGKLSAAVASDRITGTVGSNLPSSGVIRDRQWNSGIRLTSLTTRSGLTYQVASALATQFKAFVNELESTGYKIKSIGGYRKAGTGGGTGPSDPDYDRERYGHPYGASIDINPSQNPYGRSLITDMPRNISEIAAKHGLGWGGNWSSVKDAMHFSAIKREGGNKDWSFFRQGGPAFQKGGEVGEQKVKPLQRQASYEEGSGSMIYILPIRIKEQVPVPMGNNRVGFPGGLNRSMPSRVPMR